MKTIFIAFNQAHYEQILKVMSSLSLRGFTAWRQVLGRGTENGEAHFGTQAWPAMNDAILMVVDKDKVDPLLKQLKTIDTQSPELGLRAFVWNVEQAI